MTITQRPHYSESFFSIHSILGFKIQKDGQLNIHRTALALASVSALTPSTLGDRHRRSLYYTLQTLDTAYIWIYSAVGFFADSKLDALGLWNPIHDMYVTVPRARVSGALGPTRHTFSPRLAGSCQPSNTDLAFRPSTMLRQLS